MRLQAACGEVQGSSTLRSLSNAYAALPIQTPLEFDPPPAVPQAPVATQAPQGAEPEAAAQSAASAMWWLQRRLAVLATLLAVLW